MTTSCARLASLRCRTAASALGTCARRRRPREARASDRPPTSRATGSIPRHGEFGALATHVRFVARSCRRLARTLFHCMVRFGPKLEKRQAVLGRLVEIGAELLAITAACSKALAMAKQDPSNSG